RGGEILDGLLNAAESGPLELRARRSHRQVRIAPTIFRAAGERLLLCRLDPVDEAPMIGDELSENLVALYQNGSDAIVFTDSLGAIRAANDSFLMITDAIDVASIKGRSLAEFLSRGGVDLKILTENAARAGRLRLYATRLRGEHGAEISVEMSVSYLNHPSHPAFAFVMRDVGRTAAVRSASGPMSEEATRNIVDLVGATNLKSIVANTTEVVEKMCIETAVELTRNNRVAAAEMLGLSRQSLYVKLRKYGLLEREDRD
ncbi:MAG: helix-turn-helix domain-containing protein, partial [Pseudomonadota bacterium]